MKKTYGIFVFLLAIIITFQTNAAAAGKTYSWYCMRCPDHARPKSEADMSFIGKYGGAYIGNKPEEKVVYLTFDAGYENGNVCRILDTLKAHNVKGAFFVLDNLVRRDTALVKRMAQEGHLVCNHTAHHKDMTKLSEKAFTEEITSLENVLKDEAGITVAKFYRPPEGKFSEENLALVQSLGYKTVFWSLAYADWDNKKQPDPEKALGLLLGNVHNGAVILLHPTSKTNADILDRFLSELERIGYRFGTLDELPG